MVVHSAETIHGMAAASDGSLLLAGSDPSGKGVLVSWRPGQTQLQTWPVSSAVLHAATFRPDGTAFVVGAGGYAFKKDAGHPALERVMSHRDLRVVAMDPAETAWAAAPGRIMSRPERSTSATWKPLWSQDDWTEPFVTLAALDGRVLAACRNGRVVLGVQTA